MKISIFVKKLQILPHYSLLDPAQQACPQYLVASIKQTEKFTTELQTGAYRKFCETSKFRDIFALFFIIYFPMYLNFETMLFMSLLLRNVHVYCTSMYVS